MRRASAHGFTLIETLVALAIAAVVINGFYSALSTGSLLDRRASDQAEKIFLATNVLDRVGIDIPMRIGSDTGAVDGLNWELIISNAPTSDMELGAVYPNELVFVSVAVTAQDGNSAPVVIRAIRYEQSPL